MGERGQPLVSLIDDVMHALFGIVHIIMYVAPLAALARFAFTIGNSASDPREPRPVVASIYLTRSVRAVRVGAIAWMFGLRLLKIIGTSRESC